MNARKSLIWMVSGLLGLSLCAAGVRAAGQTAEGASSGFLRALAALEYQVETIGDGVALVCRRDVTSLTAVGRQLDDLKKLDQVLVQLERRYGTLAEFPSAEARRIRGRIASLEDALVRLHASSSKLVQSRRDVVDPSPQLFFEALQTVCPDDDAASVFDDVCKAQGGTPGEECDECFFGLLTCCEKICSVG